MNVSGKTANSTPWVATRPIASQTRSTVPLPPARSGAIWTAAALMRFMGLDGEQQAYRYQLARTRSLCILLRDRGKVDCAYHCAEGAQAGQKCSRDTNPNSTNG